MEKERRKGKYCTSECRIPKNSKERKKKAFLREQCKEMEGNNRMGKTRELFNKIRDYKRIFREKMGAIKERKVWT